MKNRTKAHAGRLIAAVNVLALVAPIYLLFRADDAEENLLAMLALVATAFLLMVADAVTIAIVGVGSKR
ncbi:MAG TPA: hypothetical protein VMU05_15050 [Dongiaceae bacterium]|nr:hypothetical protein [Dongiaceae bacterium]